LAQENEATMEELVHLGIEELAEVKVSTVSRVDESFDEAPGSIYVFSRSMIQERGYRSLREILQVVPGFTVFHRDLQYVAGVRGLNANDNEKETLLINGQQLNQVHEPDYLNGPINLDNVDRVEVVVGPSSFFQQANTLAATINVITLDADSPEALVGVGSALPYSATFMTGHKWAPDRFLSFSFSTEKVLGYDAWNPEFRPNLTGRDLTGALEWPSFFGVLNGQAQEWSGQMIAYRSVHPELLIDNGALPNNGSFVDQFYTVFAKNEHAWSSDLKRIFRAGVTLKEQTRTNEGGPPMNALEESLHQIVIDPELGVQFTGFRNHFIQAGLQGNYDFNFDDYYTYNQSSPPLAIPQTTLVDRNAYGIGVYVDDSFQANDILKLIGGVRVDMNTRLPGNRWFPGARAAAIIEPSSRWFLKLIYNRAVRMPSTLGALNQAWGANNPGAPSFANFSNTVDEPEILSTIEIQNILYFGHARLQATIYHQDLQGFISWLSPTTNVGNFKGNGTEVSFQTPVSSKLSLWANFSYNDSVLNARVPPQESSSAEQHHVEVNQDGRIIGAPKYLANFGGEVEFAPHWRLSPQLRYFTEQAAYSFVDQSFVTINNRYFVDVAVNWSERKIFGAESTLRLYIENLLNNTKEVGGQWLRDTYKPRGISMVLSADLRF
jgi:outer membrane receptor protein involved in Fe transport